MKISLTTQMLLALVLGCVCGLIVSAVGISPAYFKPLGDIFITLIRMVVVPLVFTTLVAPVPVLSAICISLAILR